MDPKSRYAHERLTAKELREQAIIEAATTVFTQKGIEKATMQDVAKEANLGIATLFRYFPKKDKLVVAVAAVRISRILQRFEAVANGPGTALAKIAHIMDQFIADLEQGEESDFKFTENFESYAAHAPEPLDEIERFNDIYRAVSREYAKIIAAGRTDGSIRNDVPLAETLTTVMNVYGIFTRKLSLQNNILTFVSDLEAGSQLQILKEILLDYLRPR